MRRSFQLVSLAVALIFVGNTAFAQKKPKGKKAEEKADGPSAAATWTDPTENEKSDKGPYSPHKDEEEGGKADAPARPNAPDRGRKRDKIDVFGQIVIGFGRAPQVTGLNEGRIPTYNPGDKATAIGFQLGGRYDISPTLSAGLRIPVTTAAVKTLQGTQNSTALGSPELMGEYRLSLHRLTTVPISFGVGIPVAAGTPDQTVGADRPKYATAYVNRMADATTGWRDSELFQVKRLPVVVGGGIRHEREDWELHGDLKFVFLPALDTKVGDPQAGGAYEGTYKINSFAMREVTTLGGTYNFLSKPLVYAGLDLAFVWTPVDMFVFDGPATKPTALQAVLEPRVGARFGVVSPSVGYIAPLGGRLGDGDVGGIRLRVDALF